MRSSSPFDSPPDPPVPGAVGFGPPAVAESFASPAVDSGSALRMLEAERQQVQQRVRRGAGIAAAGAGVLAIVAAVWSGGSLVMTVGMLLVAWLVYAIWAIGEEKAYKRLFKQMVLPPLVAAYGELRYSAEGCIGESEVNMCRFFPDVDRYSAEDGVQGRIGDTQIRFSEITVQVRRQHTDSKGHTSTHYETVFHGLFLVADFNKHFNGMTFVLPDTTEALFGKFGQTLQSWGAKLHLDGRQLVRLEDPEFERAFAVYSHDQVEARYLLSSSLMRRLLDLRRDCGAAFYLAFMHDAIYLAIPHGGPWLEAPSLSTPITPAALSTVLRQLQLATGIVQALDLNTRIWSKAPSGGAVAPAGPGAAGSN